MKGAIKGLLGLLFLIAAGTVGAVMLFAWGRICWNLSTAILRGIGQ